MLVLGDGVASVAKTDDGGWRVDLVSGRTLAADAVVSGSGARPNLALAESAGLEIENGGVVTDHGLRTSNGTSGRSATSRTPTTRRPAGRCGSSTGARPRPWARSPAPTSPGRTAAGSSPRILVGDRRPPAEVLGLGRRARYGSARRGPGGGWAVWYAQDSTVVGVLTCDWDAEYERGQTLIERGADLSEALARNRRTDVRTEAPIRVTPDGHGLSVWAERIAEAETLTPAAMVGRLGLDLDSATLLVVAAHPDDETLGCGRLMHTWSRRSAVHAMVATAGEACVDHVIARPPELAGRRLREWHRALDTLGVRGRAFSRFAGRPGGRSPGRGGGETRSLARRAAGAADHPRRPLARRPASGSPGLRAGRGCSGGRARSAAAGVPGLDDVLGRAELGGGRLHAVDQGQLRTSSPILRTAARAPPSSANSIRSTTASARSCRPACCGTTANSC